MVARLPEELPCFEQDLHRMTGHGLLALACDAAGVSVDWVRASARVVTFGVVPISAGEGIIEGFSQAVEAVLRYVGFAAFTTSRSDVSGLAEAIEKGAGIVFLADDERFVAIDLARRRVVDNARATALGYVTALEALMNGLEGKEVLVIGAGRVGTSAAEHLRRRGALVGVHDVDVAKMTAVAQRLGLTPEPDLDSALRRYTILFDASPAAGIIAAEHMRPDTVVAAPGIPLGLTPEAFRLVRQRTIHDVLQIGVATMAVMSLTGWDGERIGGIA
jgi:pyrrolysine biosynthesis protein PylD